MNLPGSLLDALGRTLPSPVRAVAPVGGGCIANACRVETEQGPFFLKWSRDADVARTFAAEAAGLRALRAAESPLVVPGVRAVEAAGGASPAFLLLDWIEQGRGDRVFWERFGQGLAALHRHAVDRYGFDGDNFIGRLPQENDWSESWVDFFLDRRLLPQVRMARERGRWSDAWERPFERLCARLPDLLPDRPEASILHGDLWSGNFLITAGGDAALVDPAAYHGHRETDLAMTGLFGGFDARFYAAYRAAWPLGAGYEERREIYNLYHLLNHLNHFGGGYAGSVASTLRRFG